MAKGLGAGVYPRETKEIIVSDAACAGMLLGFFRVVLG